MKFLASLSVILSLAFLSACGSDSSSETTYVAAIKCPPCHAWKTESETTYVAAISDLNTNDPTIAKTISETLTYCARLEDQGKYDANLCSAEHIKSLLDNLGHSVQDYLRIEIIDDGPESSLLFTLKDLKEFAADNGYIQREYIYDELVGYLSPNGEKIFDASEYAQYRADKSTFAAYIEYLQHKLDYDGKSSPITVLYAPHSASSGIGLAAVSFNDMDDGTIDLTLSIGSTCLNALLQSTLISQVESNGVLAHEIFHIDQLKREYLEKKINVAHGRISGGYADTQNDINALNWLTGQNRSYESFAVEEAYANLITFSKQWIDLRQRGVSLAEIGRQQLAYRLSWVLYGARAAYRLSTKLYHWLAEESQNNPLGFDQELIVDQGKFIRGKLWVNHIEILKDAGTFFDHQYSYTCTLPNTFGPTLNWATLREFVRQQNNYFQDIYYAAVKATEGFDPNTGAIINPEIVENFANQLDRLNPVTYRPTDNIPRPFDEVFDKTGLTALEDKFLRNALNPPHSWEEFGLDSDLNFSHD